MGIAFAVPIFLLVAYFLAGGETKYESDQQVKNTSVDAGSDSSVGTAPMQLSQSLESYLEDTDEKDQSEMDRLALEFVHSDSRTKREKEAVLWKLVNFYGLESDVGFYLFDTLILGLQPISMGYSELFMAVYQSSDSELVKNRVLNGIDELSYAASMDIKHKLTFFKIKDFLEYELQHTTDEKLYTRLLAHYVELQETDEALESIKIARDGGLISDNEAGDMYFGAVIATENAQRTHLVDHYALLIVEGESQNRYNFTDKLLSLQYEAEDIISDPVVRAETASYLEAVEINAIRNRDIEIPESNRYITLLKAYGDYSDQANIFEDEFRRVREQPNKHAAILYYIEHLDMAMVGDESISYAINTLTNLVYTLDDEYKRGYYEEALSIIKKKVHVYER